MSKKISGIILLTFVALFGFATITYRANHQPLSLQQLDAHCQSAYDPNDKTVQAECRYSYLEEKFIDHHYGSDSQGLRVAGFDALNRALGLASGSQTAEIEFERRSGDDVGALNIQTDVLLERYNSELRRR